MMQHLVSLYSDPLRAEIHREDCVQSFYHTLVDPDSADNERFNIPRFCTIQRCVTYLLEISEFWPSPTFWKQDVIITTKYMEGAATYARMRDRYTLNIRRLSDHKTVLHAIGNHVYTLSECVLEVLACDAWRFK